MERRNSGILCAISSLPGTLGIGDFGSSAYQFVDKLSDTKAEIWQILPMNPLGYGNSPYQTYSSFAGDEIFISIEMLYESMNLSLDIPSIEVKTVDYDEVRKHKDRLLRNAFEHFTESDAYLQFVKNTHWLQEYASFMALRKLNNNTAWLEWTSFTVSDEEVRYQYFLQYVFFEQWYQLKEYANQNNIQIMGDIPIYIGHDSAEVYYHRELFHLDEKGNPTLVAGVPPDYFSTEGQLWGNPIYDWEMMRSTNYQFWVERLSWNQKLFDVIRIDHFRAFDTYWAIEGNAKTAKEGQWIVGPRHEFFETMFNRIDDLNIVVEDLGDLRPEVLELRDDFDLMGMQIAQFSLKTEEIERDKTMPKNLLVYTGTHDNQPLGGWREDTNFMDRLRVRNDLRKLGFKEDHIIDRICHYALSLNANCVILPVQDLLHLGNEARMNTPSTVGSPNWEWKLKSLDELDDGFIRYKGWLINTNRVS